jgi:hypothetical protein
VGEAEGDVPADADGVAEPDGVAAAGRRQAWSSASSPRAAAMVDDAA